MAEVIYKGASNMLVPALKKQGETALERKDEKKGQGKHFFSLIDGSIN